MKAARRRERASAHSFVQEGTPFPLDATWDGLGVNFALFSANATKVELCIFDNDGKREVERIELPEYTDEMAICRMPNGNGLRLLRTRPLRARRRASLQFKQTPD